MPVNTKKLLILSDSHGNIPVLTTVLQWAKNYEPDVAVFLGDGAGDVSKAELAAGFSCEWHMVRGNNDWGSSLPDAAVFACGGHRFFLSHGHRYGLHWGDLHLLITAARTNKADVALFGHTHAPFLENKNGFMLLNPGSIARPRSHCASFAVIECSPDMPPKTCFLGIGQNRNITELRF